MSRGDKKRKIRAWKREIRNKSTGALLRMLSALGITKADQRKKMSLMAGHVFHIREFVDKYEHLPVRPGPGWY
jgi:hypothetical protein